MLLDTITQLLGNTSTPRQDVSPQRHSKHSAYTKARRKVLPAREKKRRAKQARAAKRR